MDSRAKVLWIALRDGDIAKVKALLEAGADPDKADDNGYIPLPWAARWGNIEVVKALLEGGADPDKADIGGNTPLYRAAWRGNIAVVKVLLEKGADPDKADRDGVTPVRVAMENNNNEVVRLLIDARDGISSVSDGHPPPTLENTTPIGETKTLRRNRKDVLGRGSMGTAVYSGLFEATRPIAIKCIPEILEDDDDDEHDKRSKEARILSELDHPNIIRYFVFDKTECMKLIALDLCNGTLDDYIETGEVASSADRKKLIHDILSGLNYLHNENIIHNDLKPPNILMKKVRLHRTDSLVYRAVISDFGISLVLDDGRRSQTAHENNIGTEGWRSKETIESIEVKKRNPTMKVKGTKAADMFTFGLLVHYIMSNRIPEHHRHPFGKDSERNENIKNGQRKSYLSLLIHDQNDITLRFDRLLADMLVHNCINIIPSLRPVTGELLKNNVGNNQGHPLFWKPQEYLEFMFNVSNCLRDYKSNSRFVEVKENIQEKWDRYCEVGFKARIAEVAFYYNKRKYGDTLPEYLRLIRNIKEHFPEILNESLRAIPNSEFNNFFGNEGSYEDFHNYFNCRVIEAFPIVYLQLYKENIEEFKRHFPNVKYFSEDKAEIIWNLFNFVFKEREMIVD